MSEPNPTGNIPEPSPSGHSEDAQIRRVIFRLAWPSIVEQILVMLVGMVTTIFVGHIGKHALAAVGLIGMILVFIQAVFAALSTGCTVLVARLIGERNPLSAQRAVGQSLILAIASSILITALCVAFNNPMIRFFVGPEDPLVLEAAYSYFRIVVWSLPFLIIYVITAGALRGSGDTRSPMLISVAVNVVNVLLCVILIYGTPFSPPLGIMGAGVATIASRLVGAVLMLLLLFSGKSRIRLRISDSLTLDMPIINRILRIGVSASMEQIVLQGGFLVMNVIVQRMGTDSAAAYQITNNINSLANMPVFGMSMAATTLVGQALGAGQPERARRCAWQTLLVGEAVILCISVLIALFPHLLGRMYTDDPAVLAIVVKTARVLALACVPLAAVNVISASLRGAGDIIYVMLTSIVGIWCIRILFTLGFDRYFHLGLVGLYIAVVCDLTIRAALYLIRLRKGKWLEKKV